MTFDRRMRLHHNAAHVMFISSGNCIRIQRSLYNSNIWDYVAILGCVVVLKWPFGNVPERAQLAMVRRES